jgi:acyl-CoA reductase-like NAD-dependent aldehyde dehydrogenase
VTANALTAAAARAADPQGPWALVPPHGRARYLRRMAMAVLDEVDDLAGLLARETGLPRTDALLAELLPSVGGLHSLADDGPRALRDERLGRIPALRAGRRSVLVSSPLGIVGIRGSADSAWAEPLLEVAASVLAGNGVLLAAQVPAIAVRLVSAFERAGIPEGLVQVVDFDADLASVCAEVIATEIDRVEGTMLVLDDAPLDRTVSGALWAAFAASGRGPFAVRRAIVVPSMHAAFFTRMQAAAAALRVGSPLDPETEVAAPPVVRRPSDPEAGAGGVLTIIDADSEEDAIAQARGGGTVSVWAGDRAHGERVARILGAELAWVNDHGYTSPAAPVRLARHVEAHQIASQPTRLRSARWLPYDPALVKASTATARLMYGRESERLDALRAGAVPLARTGVRLLREALGR